MRRKGLFAFAVLLSSVLACQGLANSDTAETQELTPVALTQISSGDEPGSVIPETPLESQIIIVMDVSGSMAGYVVPNPPPAELRQILDDIYSVENDPEIVRLEDELDAILEQPVIKNAETALAKASYDRLKYIEDDLGVDIFALIQQIQALLKERGCEDHAANLVPDEPSVNEALFNLQRACKSVTEPDKNDLRDDIAFLDDPHVQELTKAISDFEIEYKDVLRTTDYKKISDELEVLYDKSGYYDLNRELNRLAAQLGLPSRLDFAKSAASSVLDLIAMDQRVDAEAQKIGLVTFTTFARELLPITTDVESARLKVKGLREQNSTNLGGGLNIALNMAEASDTPTTIILLSDGWTNIGPTRDIIMDQMVPRARAQGTRICSAGFGTKESDVDKELLGKLADETGGKYLFTASGAELVSFFIACRQESLADEVLSLGGSVGQGETVSAGQFTIEEYTAEVSLSLNYLSGDMHLLITDPTGVVVTPEYPGLNRVFTSGLELWKIKDPPAGEWSLEVSAGENGDDELGAYHVVISTQPGEQTAEEPEGPNITLILVIAAMVIGFMILLVSGGVILYYRFKN